MSNVVSCFPRPMKRHFTSRERIVRSQPSPQAFSAWSFLDSTMSCDVTERYSPRTTSQYCQIKYGGLFCQVTATSGEWKLLSLYMFHRIIFLLLWIVSSLFAILIGVPFVFSRSKCHAYQTLLKITYRYKNHWIKNKHNEFFIMLKRITLLILI